MFFASFLYVNAYFNALAVNTKVGNFELLQFVDNGREYLSSLRKSLSHNIFAHLRIPLSKVIFTVLNSDYFFLKVISRRFDFGQKQIKNKRKQKTNKQTKNR